MSSFLQRISVWMLVALLLLPSWPPVTPAVHAAPTAPAPVAAPSAPAFPRQAPLAAPLAQNSPTFPSQPAASLAFDLSGTWSTRAWSTRKPYPFAPDFNDSGFITIVQRGTAFTGTFTVTSHVPPSTGTLNGTIATNGSVAFAYTVTAGSPLYVGRTQSVAAQVSPDGTLIAGTWSESSGYGGTYYAFNQQVAPHPVQQSFGDTGSVCGRPKACAYGLDPVNLATGNATWAMTDLQVYAPGRPFAWARTYNSRNLSAGVLGRGWSLSYDVHLDLSTPGRVGVVAEDGSVSVYPEVAGQFVRPQAEFATLSRLPDGTYTLVRPDQTTLRFAADGRLAALEDQSGSRTTLTYANGRLQQLTDSVGRSYSITTNAAGKITRLDDLALQRSLVYTYTGDLLTAVADPLGRVTSYGYTDGYLSSITLPDGSLRVQNRYDAQGRVVWQQEWTQAPATIAYDLPVTDLTVTITLPTPPPGGSATLSVTPVARRTQVTDGQQRVTSYDHDDAGRLLRLTLPDGTVTRFQVNGNDQRVQATNALGQSAQLRYDAAGNLLSVRDPAQVGVDYAYDGQNQLVAQRDSLGQTTAYTYTPEGRLRQVTDALGHTTTYTTSALHLATNETIWVRTAEQDALGRVTSYVYNTLGQFTATINPLGQRTERVYDVAGRLVRQVDTGGRTICLSYDAADQVVATTANCRPDEPATVEQNVTTTFGYDLLGRRVWVRDALGSVTRTEYDAEGRVRAVVAGCAVQGVPATTGCDPYDPQRPEWNRATRSEYDGQGRLSTTTDPLGVVTQVTYDAYDRVVAQTRNVVANAPTSPTVNVRTQTEYDTLGRVKATIDPLGRRTETRYNAAGQLSATIVNAVDGNPQTGTADSDLLTQLTYDAAGRPTAEIVNAVDGAWNPARPDEDLKTVTQYDALGRVSALIEAYVDGVAGTGEVATDRIMTFQYDAVGNLVAQTDPLGRVTVTEYDALNRPVLVVENCTDGAGQPRAQGCATGHGAGNDENVRTATSYTLGGEVATRTDTLGRISSYQYDGLGRVVSQTANADGAVAPANVRTIYAYNALGATTAITDASGAIQLRAYNPVGWLVSLTDAANRTTSYRYDALGRPVVRIDPLGHEAHTRYDALGQVSAIVQHWQNGVWEPQDAADEDLINAREYDAAGRQVAIVDPAGQRTVYRYDGLDRLVAVVENAGGQQAPRDVESRYAYDRLGRRTVITDPLNHTRTFQYDAAGRQVAQVDGLGQTTSYQYDRAGRLVAVSDPRPLTVSHHYDLLDRLVQTMAPGLAPISIRYDVLGRRAELTDGTGTTSYSYDGLDRLETVTTPATGQVEYGYDAVGRRTQLTYPNGVQLDYGYAVNGQLHTVQQGATELARYTYDPAGRLATATYANGAETTYSYDGANRLRELHTQVDGATTSRFQYTLDRRGLRTVVSETLAGTPGREVSYSYDGLLRLTGASTSAGASFSYGYDLAGNRTSATIGGTTTTRSYNAANQVVGWSYDGAGNLLSDGTSSYSYDALGRLTSRDGTSYSYNGDGVLVAQTAGTITTRYTQDLAAPLSQVLSDGTATYFYGLERFAAQAGGTTTWYGTDALGSVRQTLDATGASLATVSYDPWGEPEGSPISSFGFTGELQDAAGQVYLRARWYNVSAGQFHTRDPFIGIDTEPQSLHLYSYVHNNPANFVDPSGWYRCVDGAQDYKVFCQDQYEKMDQYLDLKSEESWIRVDSLRALLFMFSDYLQSSDVPGGSGVTAKRYRQKDLTPAAERLEFILWYTETSPGSPGHFREDLTWNDSGFAKELQDGQLWRESRRQVGHFLTATHLGYQGYLPSPVLDIACIVGHEMSSDTLLGGMNEAYQCASGLVNDGTQHVQRFLDAVLADVEGDAKLRDCLLYDIVGLPDEFDSTNFITEKLRYGNSMQDMRLSVKGWIFGQKIKGGSISSLEQGRQWLITNLRPH